MTKNERILIRINQSEKVEFEEIANRLDIPISQIAREAIREKMAELKRTHPRLQTETTQLELGK